MTESARPGSSATTVQRDLPKAAGRGDAAEHPPRVAPPLFHPLCGSNPATLLALLAGNGPVPPSQWHRLAIAALASVARWPFSVLERGSVALARRHAAAMPAPVFIIGHWRSGTTHLHNLLARSPQFGAIRPLATGLPWDLLGIVRVLRPLLEKALPVSRYVDEVAVDADSPQEDSIALANMLPLSYYHGVYFPRRFEHHFYRGVFFDDCGEDELRLWEQRLAHLLEKVCLAEQGRRLVIKNPVYTAHTARLSAMWPQARFIHIYRDPFRVLPSTRHFYATLLRQLALQPYEDLPLDRIILDGYVRLLNALYRDVPALPQPRDNSSRYVSRISRGRPCASSNGYTQRWVLPTSTPTDRCSSRTSSAYTLTARTSTDPIPPAFDWSRGTGGRSSNAGATQRRSSNRAVLGVFGRRERQTQTTHPR